MKIKVCGMRQPNNIAELGKLPINFMGLIFYLKSPRYIDALEPIALDSLPKNIDRVGVFVNEDRDTVISLIAKYGLTQVQLHGNESPQYCLECRNLSSVEIIKAFSIAEVSDFEQTKEYEDICQYFLFDTKTPQYGGSGQKFDWSILNNYIGKTPFFLSGGISAEDAKEIKKIKHPIFFGVDINSRFESEAGLKDIKQIEKFIKALK